MDRSWVKLLPRVLRERIERREDLQKFVGNTSWLFADRILRMGIGLFVGVWVARYLGPEQFGLYSYALAFVALFSTLATLGLDSIVVREIVRRPADRDEILGTAFVLKFAGAAIALLAVVAGAFALRPHDSLTHWLVAVIAAGMVFQAFDVVDFWFQSQLQSRLSVYAKTVAFLAISIVKVLLILNAAPLIAFAWAGLSEIAIGAAGLAIVYRANGQDFRAWRANLYRGKLLLRDSWPLIVSGLAIAVYMKIDQIMLGEMIGDQAVGVFSAAARISEAVYFVPMIIASSALPAIIEAKRTSEESYYQRVEKLVRVMAGMALAIVIPIAFLADHVVRVLYGSAYVQAGPVLAIHIWAAVFVFLGVAQSPWTVGENLTRLLMLRTLVGAVANVALNILLIPSYGALGAAIATIVSYSLSAFLLNAIDRRTRIFFLMQLSAITLTRRNRK
jgi:PST family polysaccharide transporter